MPTLRSRQCVRLVPADVGLAWLGAVDGTKSDEREMHASLLKRLVDLSRFHLSKAAWAVHPFPPPPSPPRVRGGGKASRGGQSPDASMTPVNRHDADSSVQFGGVFPPRVGLEEGVTSRVAVNGGTGGIPAGGSNKLVQLAGNNARVPYAVYDTSYEKGWLKLVWCSAFVSPF